MYIPGKTLNDRPAVRVFRESWCFLQVFDEHGTRIAPQNGDALVPLHAGNLILDVCGYNCGTVEATLYEFRTAQTKGKVSRLRVLRRAFRFTGMTWTSQDVPERLTKIVDRFEAQYATSTSD